MINLLSKETPVSKSGLLKVMMMKFQGFSQAVKPEFVPFKIK